MIYGIDLGTTNSLIGHGDTLYTGLVSSNVDLEKRQQVERNIINPNISSSYKANMTTGEAGEIPILSSSIVLAELAKRTEEVTHQPCQDVVISVPAKFSNTQRTAVAMAAQKAGLNLKGLINEPTAAAIYACHSSKRHVLVYDLGGGTFDVTLLDSRFGTYLVEATEGLILAGDDFDRALVDYAINEAHLLIKQRTPYNKAVLKNRMRIVKESIQRTMCAQEFDFSVIGVDFKCMITPEIYFDIMQRVFKPTIDLAKKVLMSNPFNEEDPLLVFVGGSTICPYLRAWVSKLLGLEEFKYEGAADFAVAKGVSLYAEMLENGEVDTQVDDVTQRLSIEDAHGWALPVIEKNTIIPYTAEINVCNEKAGNELTLDLYAGDNTLCIDNEYLGTLTYKYSSYQEAGEGWVAVSVTVDRSGLITIIGTDILTLEQQQITITRR